MPTPYTQDLERECHKSGWSFVNPILSSSYMGKLVSGFSTCFAVRQSHFLRFVKLNDYQGLAMEASNKIQRKSGE